MKHIFRIIIGILSVALVGCDQPEPEIIPDTTLPSLGTPDDNEIWFTLTDNRGLFAMDRTAFNTTIEDIEYEEYGVSKIRFTEALTTIGANAFNGCTNIQNMSLPNSVQTIGEQAFFNCTNLEGLTLGYGLRNCESKAFDNCINLHSLHITSVADWCSITFADRTSNPAYYSQALLVEGEKIKRLNISNRRTAISPYAFCRNIYITEVVIPASIESIGVNAFDECDNIKKVVISDLSKWSVIEFGSETANPLSIAQSLYMNEQLVTDVELVDVEEVSAYAFINCTSIKSLTSDSSLSHIGDNALRNCTSLKTAVLGSGIKEIGAQAFMNCSELKSVTIHATTPPVLVNNSVFAYNNKERIFAVPSASLDSYIEDDMWSRYKECIIAIE